jgi:hypothetical protein
MFAKCFNWMPITTSSYCLCSCVAVRVCFCICDGFWETNQSSGHLLGGTGDTKIVCLTVMKNE